MKPTILYSDFAKLDLRIGTILECSEVVKSQKLVKFLIDLGDPPAGGGKRTILAGVKGKVVLEKLIGLQVVVLANLEPKKMMGMESQGMILMGVEVETEKLGEIEGSEALEKITLLIPEGKVKEGTVIE